jgi:hypothetical protein
MAARAHGTGRRGLVAMPEREGYGKEPLLICSPCLSHYREAGPESKTNMPLRTPGRREGSGRKPQSLPIYKRAIFC